MPAGAMAGLKAGGGCLPGLNIDLVKKPIFSSQVFLLNTGWD